MRIKFVIILIAVFCGLSIHKKAFSRSGKIDTINFLLESNAVFEIDSDNPYIKSFANVPDTFFQHEVLSQINKAKNNKDHGRELRGLIALAQYYKYNSNFNKAEYYLTLSVDIAKTDNELNTVWSLLAEVKLDQDRYLEALEYLRQTKQRIIRTNNNKALARILLKEGYCYTQLANYDIAESQYNQAYSLIEQNAIRELYGEIFLYRGHYYYKQFDYLNALGNFYKGLEFFEQDTVIKNYAIILDYIGKIYFYQSHFNKAVTYFLDAKALYKKTEDREALGMINYQLALTYIKTHSYTKAIAALNKARQWFYSIDSKASLAGVNITYSDIFNNLNQPDSAALYLQKAEPLIVGGKANMFEFGYYSQKTKYFIATNQPDSAYVFANKAKKVCGAEPNVLIKIKCYYLLADMYEHTGNLSKALINQKAGFNLQDSLNRSINSYEIKVLQSELELSKNQVLIEHLTDERNRQDKTIKKNIVVLERQKVFIYHVLVVLLLIIVIAFLLGSFLNQKRKDNSKLSARNRQIAQQKEEIEQQQQHLLEVNQELEKLSIVARETDNGIKIMNEVGRVLWVNEGYTKMYGYTIDDLRSVENIDLLGEKSNIDIQQLVNVWYGDKQPITYESLNKTKDDCDIWVQTTLTPILAEDGKIDKMIAIDSDISVLKKAENEILTKNKDITSSISYAKRIQEAMMTPFDILTSHFENSFFFHKPKSIVSGDFYWMSNRHDRLVVVCADSTGHGVPGAFMSMIGMSFLNKIVNEKGFVSPAIILNRMRMNVINHLHQSGSDAVAGDGMDMSVITIDKRNNQLEYAGAMNPITIARNQDLIELKPDRMPVGYFDNEDRPFSSTVLSIEANDIIYMYTDGYYDQFGGKSGSKMKSHRFKKIMKNAALKPVKEQKAFIEHEFDKWKGTHSQVDDVLVIGIKID